MHRPESMSRDIWLQIQFGNFPPALIGQETKRRHTLFEVHDPDSTASGKAAQAIAEAPPEECDLFRGASKRIQALLGLFDKGHKVSPESICLVQRG